MARKKEKNSEINLKKGNPTFLPYLQPFFPSEISRFYPNPFSGVDWAVQVFYCTKLHCTKMNLTALHFMGRYCTALRGIAVHCILQNCSALHYTTLHCIALDYTTLHCTALHCAALLYSLASPGHSDQEGPVRTQGVRHDTAGPRLGASNTCHRNGHFRDTIEKCFK